MAITAIALVPVLATIAIHAGRSHLPVQDFALVDLRVRDVWSADIPLVGTYSRFGWNHPGPAMFWLIALFSGPFGRPAWATVVGSAVLQGVAIVAAARLAWVRGRLGLTIGVLAVLGLGYAAAGSDLLRDAWNPYVAFPFFVLFVLELWSVALGDTRQILWAGLVGTFLAQTHVGYVPFVAVGGLWAAGHLAVDVRRGARPPALARRVSTTAAVVALVWIPVVVEQVRHGTIGLLVTYFVSDSGPAIGVRRGAGLLADQFRVPPPWLGGSARFDAFHRFATPASPFWLLIAVALVAIGAFAVARTRSVEDRRLLELASLFAVVGVVALARISGDLAPYLFLWRIPVALLVVLAAVRASTRLVVRPRGRAALRWAGTGLAVVVGTAAVLVTVSVADAKDDATMRVTRRVPSALRDDGLPTRPVLVRQAGLNPLGLEGGLFDALDRGGTDVRVDPERGFEFGYHRTASAGDVGSVWYVVEGGQFLSVLSELPGARVLTSTSPLDAGQERELRSGQRRLARQLARAGRPGLVDKMGSSLFPFAVAGVPGVDQTLARRVGRLNEIVEHRGVCRCAVIAVPPAAARFHTFSSWAHPHVHRHG